ncbi:MAG: DivIVA domain-containing protein [Coriobacteriales bacterium]|jgi:cell division initiation protein|nr:DivIVA domain-containing protein [Coriobacteriales bacterium]
MSITALEIQEVRFGEVKKGYNPDEVDEFLERVATDVDTLNRALSEAAARIKAAEARAEEAERRLEEAPSAPASAPVDEVKSESTISEDVISKAFIAAQKSADALQAEARKEAEKVYREAESKGRDIVREALAEKQKTLAEVDRLRESSEQFRTEYLSLLKHFQADAQKRLTAFDEVVPSKPAPAEDARKVQERIIAANDATVPPAGDSSKSSAAKTGAAPAASVPPLTPVQPPASLAQADDDDELDIEEID